MLPLRISVEGFMSYRDRTTFDFEGARLWMLSGANGAGKSTVFDALRWVLFGVHRGGKQKPEQLIHHEAAKLLVEIELELGEEIYKLKRTLGREGARPTWDVARRVGNAWESVAGTSLSNEYNHWIESHIGLTDEAFCASVYLSQGRADAILNADAEARYELLSQLVDLEVYEDWHARAEERRSEARAQMTDARRRWETAPSPAPERVIELREREAELEQNGVVLGERVRELDGARSDASRWEEWNGKLAGLETQAAKVREVLQNEEVIEREFVRLSNLKNQKGAVDALWQAWNRCSALEAQLAVLGPQLAQVQETLSRAQARAIQTSAAIEIAQNSVNEANGLWSTKVSEALALAPQRAVIEYRGRLLAQRAEQSRLRESFEEDGEVRLGIAERELANAREAARALPLWRRFAQAQRAFEEAQQQHGEWMERQQQAQEQQEKYQAELVEARNALENATAELETAKQEVARMEERERALNVRRADFAQVAGEARCHFCGQELSEEHRAAEMERLGAETQVVAEQKTKVHESLKAAQKQVDVAYEAETLLAKALNKASADAAEAMREVRHQGDIAIREHAAARSAWEELGTESQARWEKSGLEMDKLAGITRPNATDLKELEAQARTVADLEADVLHWRERLHERALVVAELKRLDLELEQIIGQWNDTQVEEWQLRAAQIEQEKEAAQKRRDDSQLQLETLRREANTVGQEERAVRERAEELERQRGPIEGQLMAATEALRVAQQAFDEALERSNERPLSLAEVQVLRDERMREMNELESGQIVARHTALMEARGKLADTLRDQQFYRDQIGSLSLLARRPRAEVEAEWSAATTRQVQAVAEREEAGDLLRQWEREEKERGELEARLQERTLDFERWDELAKLLGPHQLQRHLLREAERSIVREANSILEAISGGTLRLELVPDSDEGSGNKKPKVLDVMCYHLTGSDEPQAIAPAFLSGSQRFRVAVALALGIGRTAARGSGNGRSARVETILIDEGFGALDKTGRDEMKDELRELGRELGRVILVSHQEDFASAFPNRFNITLENGVSRVQKVVE